MAPFRPSRSTRSGRPTQDNDVIDGLPIRKWRLEESTVGSMAPTTEKLPESNSIWKELPMPKDSQLYPTWTQELLRAARAGKAPKPSGGAAGDGSGAANGEDDKENAALDGVEEGAKKQAQTSSLEGFAAKKWTPIPRHLEPSEREYLAKRRKGLASPYPNWSGSAGPTATTGQMRKTKVRRVDGEGNAYVWEVLVPEGQTVEGEIAGDLTLESAVAPIAAPAPGTVVEGMGVANADGVVVVPDSAQNRRRPPPPRRKPKKGPGRGRKKVAFTGSDGVSASAEAFAAEKEGTGRLPSGRLGETNGAADADTTMGGMQEEDEDEEGSDGEETGEEGEVGEEDGDREDGELSPTPDHTMSVYAADLTVSNLEQELSTTNAEEAPTAADPINSLISPPSPSRPPGLPLVSEHQAGQIKELGVAAQTTSVIEPAAPLIEPSTLLDRSAIEPAMQQQPVQDEAPMLAEIQEVQAPVQPVQGEAEEHNETMAPTDIPSTNELELEEPAHEPASALPTEGNIDEEADGKPDALESVGNDP